MTNYMCEDTTVCGKFQSAVCLHCNRRLCLFHITEHVQAVPKNIQNLFDELDATSQQINTEYEKSRNTYNKLLTSVHQWRARQTEKIDQIYENHLQIIESRQEAINIMQHELIDLLDREARQPLELIQRQQNGNIHVLDHIQQTIKKIQLQSIQLKLKLSTLLPNSTANHTSTSTSVQVTTQVSNWIVSQPPRPKKTSDKQTPVESINLRRFRSFKRLVDMFDNISAIEESKEEIATYLKKQDCNFQLPTLVCSYLTAWHRKPDRKGKDLLLDGHISTVAKYLPSHSSDAIILLGIHAFFFNETILGSKREMMTFLLQYFVDHKCLNPKQVLNWYNRNIYGYLGFDGVKQLTTPFIKSLSRNNIAASSQTVPMDSTKVEEAPTVQIKDEPGVST